MTSQVDGKDVRRRRRRGSALTSGETPRPLDLGPLNKSVGFHLRITQEASVRSLGAMLEQPYKAGVFSALMVIRLNPGLSQSELSRAIGRDKSTMSPLIRDLSQQGLVQRDGSERDRRSVHLRLTAAGEAALAVLHAGVQAHEARMDSALGDAKPALLDWLRALSTELSGGVA